MDSYQEVAHCICRETLIPDHDLWEKVLRPCPAPNPGLAPCPLPPLSWGPGAAGLVAGAVRPCAGVDGETLFVNQSPGVG